MAKMKAEAQMELDEENESKVEGFCMDKKVVLLWGVKIFGVSWRDYGTKESF